MVEPMNRRLLVAILLALAAPAAQAQGTLLLSHVQHFYAGGGACAERFWLEWINSKAEITQIEIHLELQAAGEETTAHTLRLARLGTSTADRASEILLETPSCLSGKTGIVVRKASATITGQEINLLQNRQLQAGRVVHYPITISK